MNHRHHDRRPVARPVELRVRVSKVTERGVQVRCVDDRDGALFWLPVGYPAEWPALPEIGETVSVKVPRWMAERHKPVRDLRSGYQSSLSPLFTPLPGIDPVKGKESIPMAYDNNMTGALFKNHKRETDKHPLYTGSCEVNGQKLWISAWLKQSKSGETYMSLAFKPADEQRQQPKSNSYAAATGREQSPDRPTFQRRVEDEIPF